MTGQVQTEDQYIFIHDALVEAVQSGNTEVSARHLYAHLQKLSQPLSDGSCGMETEFKVNACSPAAPSHTLSHTHTHTHTPV